MPSLGTLAAPQASILQPGTNCWRLAHARRVSILVDAQNYYSALLAALKLARRRVMILAWDIDTRVVLNPGLDRLDASKTTLGKAIQDAVEANPSLEILILCWDFAMIYALERQLLPRRAFRHPRIRFVLDSRHPFGASQHQKFVIIDDQLAFTGGLDLCLRRWDTRSHRANDPRRVDHRGKPYLPFHDVQILVDDEAAAALAELARDRWESATGERLSTVEGLPPHAVRWPAFVRPDFERINLAIARTYFVRGPSPHVREVERLFLDSIAAARRHVYIENQYFTSNAIADAIKARLKRRDCPEFLIVLPRFNAGWLEESTMGTLRSRLIRKLIAQDRPDRIRFYYPAARGPRTLPISLHSKVMVVDDRLLHTGSANLSNRSMGLDTECDIAIEGAPGSEVGGRITAIRDALIAEHLGATRERVSAIIEKTGSLIRAMEELGSTIEPPRALIGFPETLSRIADALTPNDRVLDPDRPTEEDPFYSRFVPRDKPGFRNLKLRQLYLRLIFAAIAAHSPAFRAQVDRQLAKLLPVGCDLERHPWGGAAAYYTIGTALFVPTDVLSFGLSFARLRNQRVIHSLTGLMIAGIVPFALGKLLPRKPEALVQRHGFWGHFLVQANLFAPLAQVSFKAGRMNSPIATYALATLFGNVPRVALGRFFARSLMRSSEQPSVVNRIAAVSVALLILGAFRWSSHRFLPSYGGRPEPRKRPSVPFGI